MTRRTHLLLIALLTVGLGFCLTVLAIDKVAEARCVSQTWYRGSCLATDEVSIRGHWDANDPIVPCDGEQKISGVDDDRTRRVAHQR